MGLSRTVSEIEGDFSRKSPIFSHPLVFCVSDEGFPLEFGTGAGRQKLEWWGCWAERGLTIFLAVWIHSTNVTDGQKDTGRQQIPRLRIASRGIISESSSRSSIELLYRTKRYDRLHCRANKVGGLSSRSQNRK